MKFRNLFIRYMEEQPADGAAESMNTGDEGTPSTGDFNPRHVEQGQNLLGGIGAPIEESEEDDGAIDPDVIAAADELDSKDTPTEGAKDESEGESESEVFNYKGVDVEVKNDPEVEAAFQEKGLDIGAVNKELYSEEGLTQETKDKLYEAFGKPTVDLYLKSWEANNDALIAQSASYLEAQEREAKALVERVAGSTETFADAVKWAQENLDESTYDAVAQLVNSENQLQAELGIQHLLKLAGKQKSEPKPSVRKPVVSAQPTTSTRKADALSQAQYMKLFENDEYFKNPAKYDAMRERGRKMGI